MASRYLALSLDRDRAVLGAFTTALPLHGGSEATPRLGLEAFARSEPRVSAQESDSPLEALATVRKYL
eukprot:jgi/Tetstr1/420944/TSEL_012005.t1